MRNKFKTELITGMLSSPVIYIHTSDYRYVDAVMRQALIPDDPAERLFDIKAENIFEFDPVRGMVNFDDKAENPYLSSLDNLLEALKSHWDAGTEVPQITLVKNCGSMLCETGAAADPMAAGLPSILSYISAKYEDGGLHRLSTVILVSPEPIERLQRTVIDLVKVIELPVPAFEEIEDIVRDIPVSRQAEFAAEQTRLDFARNLQGLRRSDIRQILRSTLVRTGGRLSRQTIALALEEKKQIVRKTGIIEVVDTDERLANVGGLENLIEEIRRKKVVFDNLSLAQSKSAMVPLPKGILIIGMPGCGKSMIAKSIAAEFGVTLLRLDVNRLMGKYVGESETNLRMALATAEAAHPCVLWIDEIEKAFAGTDSGNNDIIVRLIGHFLTWMQERRTAVYVVATANDTLKPELMRKGRFDDVFFVDFPNARETASILRKTISRYARADFYDFSDLSRGDTLETVVIPSMFDKETGRGFSGAEINALVGMAVEEAFREHCALRAADPQAKPGPIKISVNKLTELVSLMRPYIMSNQLRPAAKGQEAPDSAISRISRLRTIFSLKPASKDV